MERFFAPTILSQNEKVLRMQELQKLVAEAANGK
jgi:hypothetical protein